MKTARELLIELETILEEIDDLEASKGAALLAATPREVRLALMEVEDAYSIKLADAEGRRKSTEKKLKASVIEEGQSCAGSRIIAVLGSPRVTWNKKGLEDYMKNTNQYIRKFRKIGAAPVSIRAAAPLADDEFEEV